MGNRTKHAPTKRVPVVQQIEAAECGAAALCMVLGYYGLFVELSDMRKACRISRDGTTLKNIMDAARGYGMEAKSYRTLPKNFTKLQFPLIVFWQNRHYLVVEELTDSKAVLCDPANGRRKVSRDEFEEGYSGIVLQLKPAETFRAGGKPYSQTHALAGLLKKSSTVIVYLSIVIVLLNIIGLMIPKMTSTFVDYYLPALGYVNTGPFLTILLVILVVQFILLLVQKRVVLQYEKSISASINENIYDKLMKLPLDFFQSRGHFSMLSRIYSIDTLAGFLAAYLVPVSLGLIFSIIYIVLMFTFSVTIGIMVLVIIIPVICIMLVFSYQAKQENLRNENLKISFTANVIQSFQLFDTIKASALEEDTAINSMNAYIDYQNSLQKTKGKMALLNAIPAVLPLLIQAATIIIGCNLTLSGKMTTGDTLACQSIAMSIFGPISSFINGMVTFQKQDANARGLYDINREEADPISERRVAKAGLTYNEIQVKNVAFAYNTSAEPVVQNINFRAEPGKSVALVGGTGSGKSTILKLVEGLYFPQEGEILYNGTPIINTNREEFNRSIAVVSQQPQVFGGTVRENITLFDSRISDNEIIAALKDTCIYDEITERRGGLDQLVEKGNCSFSGGQIQRMMIARALVRKPEILILDEATSALDSIVEEEIMRNIRAKNMTLIIVSHRLSTVRDCNEILVLDKGSIVERGSHEELLAADESAYKMLVMSEEDD